MYRAGDDEIHRGVGGRFAHCAGVLPTPMPSSVQLARDRMPSGNQDKAEATAFQSSCPERRRVDSEGSVARSWRLALLPDPSPALEHPPETTEGP